MAKHDDLLAQGPRQAPEPETAEARSRSLKRRGLLGGAAVGGGALLKLGAFGKALLWIAAWHGLFGVRHLGSWTGALVSAAVVAALLSLVALAFLSRASKARHDQNTVRELA